MKSYRKLAVMLLLVLMLFSLATTAFAAGTDAPAQAVQEETETGSSAKSYSAAIAIGLSAAGGAIAMGMVASKAVESISRQPEAESKIRTALMLGLVFIETAIIYALLVVILIIFVL